MARLHSKEKQFYEFYDRAAENTQQAALELSEFLARFDNPLERARRIKDLEHKGDRLTHDMMERLHKTFITSIDRGDIRVLASRLDDIIDSIDEVANRIVLYRLDHPRSDARALAEILSRATTLIVETMPLLRNMENNQAILANCREIAALEKEADRASELALTRLFDSFKDPIPVIKWKDIYEELETACNHCKHVANVIEEIVIKNM